MEPAGKFQFRQDIFCSSDRILIVVTGDYVKRLLSIHLNNNTLVRLSGNCSRCFDFDKQVVPANIGYGS
jgi:hypothetical protein